MHRIDPSLIMGRLPAQTVEDRCKKTGECNHGIILFLCRVLYKCGFRRRINHRLISYRHAIADAGKPKVIMHGPLRRFHDTVFPLVKFFQTKQICLITKCFQLFFKRQRRNIYPQRNTRAKNQEVFHSLPPYHIRPRNRF